MKGGTNMLKHRTSICNVDFSIMQCSYFPALTLTALHAEDNKLTSLARWANSVSKISNGYESSSGFVIVISNNWDFLMSGFPPSTQKQTHGLFCIGPVYCTNAGSPLLSLSPNRKGIQK